MSENAEIEEWLRSLPDMFTAQSIADNLRDETKSSECSPAQDRTFVDFLSKEIKEYREELETKLQRLKRLEEGVAIRSTVSCYIKLHLTDKFNKGSLPSANRCSGAKSR